MNKNKKTKQVQENKKISNMEKNMDMGALVGISHIIESDVEDKKNK